MNAKQEILDRLRDRVPGGDALPELEGPWVTYEDPQRQFCEVLEAVGGRGVVVPNAAEATAVLAAMPAYRDAQKVCSLVAGVGQSNVALDQVEDAHALADLDFFVAPAELAVAENAAVWVTDERVRHRAVFFIAQHVALIVPADRVVHNLHEAYQQITLAEPGFGLFVSGPSKTADIEQALVIGAHGPRSLTVLLLERGADT